MRFWNRTLRRFEKRQEIRKSFWNIIATWSAKRGKKKNIEVWQKHGMYRSSSQRRYRCWTRYFRIRKAVSAECIRCVIVLLFLMRCRPFQFGVWNCFIWRSISFPSFVTRPLFYAQLRSHLWQNFRKIIFVRAKKWLIMWKCIRNNSAGQAL